MNKPFARIADQIRHLANQIIVHESEGILRFDGHRMMLLSATAFGHLRAELIHSLGTGIARGLLKRLGYQAGFHDGYALALRHPGLSLEEQMHLGTVLHQKEGIARIDTDEENTRVDLDKGVLQISSRWHNSLEAEQHVARFGHTRQPVCWMLAGYASGHLSFLFQRTAIAHERQCAAEGHAHCSFIVRFKEEMEELYPNCDDDYKTIDLSELHQDLQQKIDERDFLIRQLQNQLGPRSKKPGDAPSAFDRIVGESRALCDSVAIARAVAKVDSTVLILGESGTGKEIFASCIQRESERAAKPFLTINCATLTESLQNSELFGHVRGAFTGASSDRAGLFEQADGGTLFLDEVAELTGSAQAALLRVLQEGTLKRVGDARERRVDVRIIAATHRNLQEMIEAGHFREDLYYRLNVIGFEAPPLRDRENDILLLARHFLREFNGKFAKKAEGISAEAKRALLEYSWPGNVRELRNAIERASLLAAGPLLQLEDFPPTLKNASPGNATRNTTHTDREKAMLTEALNAHGFHRGATAKSLGISRATLWRRMKKHGLG